MASRGLYAWIAFGLILGFGMEYFAFSVTDFGPFSVRSFSLGRALVVSAIAAFAFGFVMERFIKVQSDKLRVNDSHIDGEEVIFQGGANHFKSGANAIGGWLILTDKHLLFRPHRVNIGGAELKIAVSEIMSAQAYSIAGFVPMGLRIYPKGKESIGFSVFDRDMWVKTIERRLSAAA